MRVQFYNMDDVYRILETRKAEQLLRTKVVTELLACTARSERSCRTPSEQSANDRQSTQYFAVRTSATK